MKPYLVHTWVHTSVDYIVYAENAEDAIQVADTNIDGLPPQAWRYGDGGTDYITDNVSEDMIRKYDDAGLVIW